MKFTTSAVEIARLGPWQGDEQQCRSVFVLDTTDCMQEVVRIYCPEVRVFLHEGQFDDECLNAIHPKLAELYRLAKEIRDDLSSRNSP